MQPISPSDLIHLFPSSGPYDTLPQAARMFAATLVFNRAMSAELKIALSKINDALFFGKLAPPLAAAAQPEAAEPPAKGPPPAAGGEEPISSLGIDPEPAP